MSNNPKSFKVLRILCSIPIFSIGIIQFFNHQYVASFFFISAGATLTSFARSLLKKLPSNQSRVLRSALCSLLLFIGVVFSFSFDSKGYHSDKIKREQREVMRDSVELVLNKKGLSICESIKMIDDGRNGNFQLDSNLIKSILLFKDECDQEELIAIQMQNELKRKSLLKRRKKFEDECLRDCVVQLMEIATNSLENPESFKLKSREFRLFKSYAVITIYFQYQNQLGTKMSNTLTVKASLKDCQFQEFL